MDAFFIDMETDLAKLLESNLVTVDQKDYLIESDLPVPFPLSEDIESIDCLDNDPALKSLNEKNTRTLAEINWRVVE